VFGNPEALDRAALVAKKHMRALDASAMRTLFYEARTAKAYLPQPVPADLLMRAVELVQLGPTSANCLPMRVIFPPHRPEFGDRFIVEANAESTTAFGWDMLRMHCAVGDAEAG
jgi:hypothetical protein